MVATANLQALSRGLHRRILEMRRRFWRVDFSRPRLHMARGTPLLVLPGVFDGVLTRTGVFMAETLAELSLEHARVLDLGCGSGIGAVFAARGGAQVIAADLNPEAVRNTQLNALLLKLEAQIETRTGDLFETVRGERFDLILFNPPYYHGTPRDAADAAWRSQDAFERFLREAPDHLTAEGRIRLVLSSDGDIAPVLAATPQFTTRVVRQNDFGNEVLTVYELQVKAAV